MKKQAVKQNPKQKRTVKQSEDASVLKWLLSQRFRAVKREKRLDDRLQALNDEKKTPIGGQGYEAMPRSGGNNEGAASFTFKIAEIEDRIYEQKEEVAKAIVRVMDIIEYLPVNSLEREICEMRHIDMKSWEYIQADIPMSRSQVNNRYNKAIDMLMENKRIKRLIEDHRAEYQSWVYEKEIKRTRISAKKNTPPVEGPDV